MVSSFGACPPFSGGLVGLLLAPDDCPVAVATGCGMLWAQSEMEIESWGLMGEGRFNTRHSSPRPTVVLLLFLPQGGGISGGGAGISTQISSVHTASHYRNHNQPNLNHSAALMSQKHIKTHPPP